MFIDALDKIPNLQQDKLDKSIWISPVMPHHSEQQIRQFFQTYKECGLITDIRIKEGKAVADKPHNNKYAVIEFSHENSVARSLRVASKKQS